MERVDIRLLGLSIALQITSQAKAADEESNVGLVPPDVAIIDVDGSSDSVPSVVHRSKQHVTNVGITVLTSNASDAQLAQVIENGVAAHLSKETNGDQLAETVRRVAHGEYPIYQSLPSRPELIANILSQFQEPSRKTEEKDLADPLTVRELDVLNYVAKGDSNKQIATKLCVSPQTIKNHITSILSKLDAESRTQAVVRAAQQSLISIA